VTKKMPVNVQAIFEGEALTIIALKFLATEFKMSVER
jgi:hypothetical protein